MRAAIPYRRNCLYYGDASELPLQRELNLALIVGQRGSYRGSAGDVGIVTGQLELWMIRDVEEFGAQRHGLAFVDREVLQQTYIEVHLAWSAQVAAAAITELMRELLAGRERRNDKGSRVVPALERLMADWASHGRLDSLAEGKIVGIVNAIGPGRKAAGIGGIEREDGGGGL